MEFKSPTSRLARLFRAGRDILSTVFDRAFARRTNLVKYL